MDIKDMLNKVHCADCIDFMRLIPDKSIDLVLTDPPYGIGEDIRTADNSGRREWKEENRRDLFIPSKEYFDEIFRVSKNQIIWGGNYFIEYLTNTRCYLIRDKIQEFTGADSELARTSFDKSAKHYRLSRVEFHGGEKKQHPTQKPAGLFKRCLENYSKPGMTILDPFAGSGTTGIAAKQMGRNYILIEKEQKYVDIANKRLQYSQVALF